MVITIKYFIIIIIKIIKNSNKIFFGELFNLYTMYCNKNDNSQYYTFI